jgi:single-strand DNA-binding protein
MYNKVFLIGRLTKDPEKRYTPAGIPVTRFSIAINRGFSREKQNEVDFIRITAWRKLAEICGDYLKKGRLVAIEGSLRISSFTGRDGQKRTSSEVVADNMQMLERKAAGDGSDFAGQENKETKEKEDLDFNPADFENK